MKKLNAKQRQTRNEDSRESQVVWTLCVGIAVTVAALYQVTSPKPLLSDREQPLKALSAKIGSNSSPTLLFPQDSQFTEVARERVPASQYAGSAGTEDPTSPTQN